jgi:hypothetical protein
MAAGFATLAVGGVLVFDVGFAEPFNYIGFAMTVYRLFLSCSLHLPILI